jgi:hypothetical protein
VRADRRFLSGGVKDRATSRCKASDKAKNGANARNRLPEPMGSADVMRTDYRSNPDRGDLHRCSGRLDVPAQQKLADARVGQHIGCLD